MSVCQARSLSDWHLLAQAHPGSWEARDKSQTQMAFFFLPLLLLPPSRPIFRRGRNVSKISIHVCTDWAVDVSHLERAQNPPLQCVFIPTALSPPVIYFSLCWPNLWAIKTAFLSRRPMSKWKEQRENALCHFKVMSRSQREGERGGVGVKLIGERKEKKHLLCNSLTVASETRLLLFPNKNTHFCVPATVAFCVRGKEIVA